MGSFVEFKNVGKTYHMGEVDIEALKDVNFTIERGEFCVIVGASGAGKTTILNILGGMDSLSSGQAMLDGEEISSYNKKKLTAYRRYDIGFGCNVGAGNGRAERQIREFPGAAVRWGTAESGYRKGVG